MHLLFVSDLEYSITMNNIALSKKLPVAQNHDKVKIY